MRVFVANVVVPRPDWSAGDKRFCALLEIMARHHQIDLWMPDWASLAKHAPDPEAEWLQVRALLSGLGVNVLPFGWDAFARALTFSHYHLALFEFPATAESYLAEVRRRQPGAVTVVDSVDLHFVRELAGAQLRGSETASAERIRERELGVYRSADAVIAASAPDAAILRAEGIANVFVVPTLYARRERPAMERQAEILFVGGFRHHPNVDGLLWFTSEIWPMVKTQVPEAMLTVVGSTPPPEVLALNGLPGVHIAGYAPEMAPYLDRAAVSIAPLRYGAGMKGKVVEALLAGVPVVSTTEGIQGIAVKPGVDVLVADSPDAFARAVASLLRDRERAEAMGLAGQRAAASLYTSEAVASQVREMLDCLVPRPHAIMPKLQWARATTHYCTRALVRRVTGTMSATTGAFRRTP
jgi:glycosyltransferase involved in cell wall biosynthesis